MDVLQADSKRPEPDEAQLDNGDVVSPELILVAGPEEAQRARQHLPVFPRYVTPIEPPEAEVAAEPEVAPPEPEPEPEPEPAPVSAEEPVAPEPPSRPAPPPYQWAVEQLREPAPAPAPEPAPEPEAAAPPQPTPAEPTPPPARTPRPKLHDPAPSPVFTPERPRTRPAAPAPEPRPRPAPPSYQWATREGTLDEAPIVRTPAPRRRRQLHRPRFSARLLLVTLAAATVALGGYFAREVVRRDSPMPVAALAADRSAAPPVSKPRRAVKPKTTPRVHTRTRITTTAKAPAKHATPTPRVKPPTQTVTVVVTTRVTTPSTPKPQPVVPKPKPVTGFVPTRDWGWAPQAGADAYQVTFLLDNKIVFRTRTKEPHLVLPRTFRFRAGSYRWNVRGVPSKPGTAPIVDATFVLTKATAAAANSA